MQQQPLNDTRLYACYVSPYICYALQSEGFADDTPYRWHIYSHFQKFVTNVFDYDDYYLEGQRANDIFFPPEYIVPAYSLKDVEMALPAYGLAVNAQGHYSLGVDKFFNKIGYIVDARLPDAFALALLIAIQKQLIDIETINAKISI